MFSNHRRFHNVKGTTSCISHICCFGVDKSDVANIQTRLLSLDGGAILIHAILQRKVAKADRDGCAYVCCLAIQISSGTARITQGPWKVAEYTDGNRGGLQTRTKHSSWQPLPACEKFTHQDMIFTTYDHEPQFIAFRSLAEVKGTLAFAHGCEKTGSKDGGRGVGRQLQVVHTRHDAGQIRIGRVTLSIWDPSHHR